MRVLVLENRVEVVRRGLAGLAAAGLLSLALVGGAGAQDDVAAAGNGGTAGAAANGGAVAVSDVNSGENAGNLIAVGDVVDGSVAVDGGDVTTTTELAVDTDGGAAVSDASGGDFNSAIAVE